MIFCENNAYLMVQAQDTIYDFRNIFGLAQVHSGPSHLKLSQVSNFFIILASRGLCQQNYRMEFCQASFISVLSCLVTGFHKILFFLYVTLMHYGIQHQVVSPKKVLLSFECFNTIALWSILMSYHKQPEVDEKNRTVFSVSQRMQATIKTLEYKPSELLWISFKTPYHSFLSVMMI